MSEKHNAPRPFLARSYISANLGMPSIAALRAVRNSGRGLNKIRDRLEVPPPRGYWAPRAAQHLWRDYAARQTSYV